MGNASTGITSGHEYSRSNGVKLPACNGDRIWHSVPELVPRARYPEVPGAVIPHAGIREGGTGYPASLPQSPANEDDHISCCSISHVRCSDG